MTVYKSNTKRGRKFVSNSAIENKRHYLANIGLIMFVFSAFIGSILMSNDVSAKKHEISYLKTDFNERTGMDVVAMPVETDYDINDLLIYAAQHGMVEARDAQTLVDDSGVAYYR